MLDICPNINYYTSTINNKIINKGEFYVIQDEN